jgi:hypothetical protein
MLLLIDTLRTTTSQHQQLSFPLHYLARISRVSPSHYLRLRRAISEFSRALYFLELADFEARKQPLKNTPDFRPGMLGGSLYAAHVLVSRSITN